LDQYEEKEIENNIHHIWTDFMEENKREVPEADRQLVIRERAPVILGPKESHLKAVSEIVKKCGKQKLFSRSYRHEDDEPSLYDPESPHYIYKGNDLKRSQVKQFLFFGYNANYPENQIQAIKNRGSWKILNYQEQLALCNKSMQRRIRAKSAAYPAEDMPERVAGREVDEHLIDKCHFIWRPSNWYEATQNKRIDRRMTKLSQAEQTPFVFNHFENLNGIGNKSGLIKSLRQYYYTQPQAIAASYSEFDTTATTFVVQSKRDDNQMEDMQLRFK
jgi:hypothetical protein